MVTKLGAVTKQRILVTVTVFVSLLKAIRVFSGVRPSFLTFSLHDTAENHLPSKTAAVVQYYCFKSRRRANA